ncbi:MAG: hypothetical protein V1880_03765 [Patescibacteria group bacterium]
MKKPIRNNRGSTFVELVLYIGIFLVFTPILFSVAINSLRVSRTYQLEKQVNVDAQFSSERIYDLITGAKRIDLANSRLNTDYGKLTLINQGDEEIIIELNPETERIEITEGEATSTLSSLGNKVSRLYLEKIPDNLNDPEIALGINLRMKMSGEEDGSIEQDYVLSANLQRGDYDDDACPDHIDLFPRHPECCGDGDSDGMCDELDNCILEYNPFQEDYDQDNVGDMCDISAFIEGGNSGNTQMLGAFNCSTEDDLLALIHHEPPLNSSVLKQILLSSSPLSPAVLQALVDEHPLLTNGHLQQVFTTNVLIPEPVYSNLMALDLPPGIRNVISQAQEDATESPYTAVHNPITNYQLTFYSDAPEGENWTNRVKFHTPDYPLCDNGFLGKTDIFVLDVQNGSDAIDVTTTTTQGSVTNTLTATDNLIVNSQGFALEFNEKVGNAYAILISSDSCANQMDSVELDFGTNADILSPPTSDTEYDAIRYTSYCEGGCDSNCGDVGSGIATSNILSSSCYKVDLSYPEWCSHWYTVEDNDTEHPAFVGGTQEGPETAYYEKTFKSIINELQLEHLQSITVTGEIAFQNITQFFCDTLLSSCPMEGSLIGFQDVALYDFATSTWVSIGDTNANGSISDQQAFEITYSGADVGNFIGGPGNEQIKARIEFNWNGVPPQGTSAPSFMLIDYFTVHLKW